MRWLLRMWFLTHFFLRFFFGLVCFDLLWLELPIAPPAGICIFCCTLATTFARYLPRFMWCTYTFWIGTDPLPTYTIITPWTELLERVGQSWSERGWVAGWLGVNSTAGGCRRNWIASTRVTKRRSTPNTTTTSTRCNNRIPNWFKR